MKSADFQSEIAPNGQIAVPPEIAAQIPPGEKIDVLLVWDISDQEAWRVTARRRFEAAYAADDSVYEELNNP
jgi:hypothetical protein